jgi:hypothetical protein
MLTQNQKNEILQLVEDEKQRLGSYRAVANKCRISEATISQLRKGSYAADGDDIYQTIALALGFEFESGTWNIADTTNFRIINQVLTDAKEGSMFMGIAHKAGSGKTSTSNLFLSTKRNKGVFKINCREWNARNFLDEVIREIGAEVPKGYLSINTMIDSISATVKKMAYLKPIIIFDQANSLKPAALRTLIHTFNDCEDILGAVIIGTENLEVEINRGVRLNRMGYGEINSRFGDIIHLIGATLTDVRKICEANGVNDVEQQKEIFKNCKPRSITLDDGKSIHVVEDMRMVKRKIKGYLLQQKHIA